LISKLCHKSETIYGEPLGKEAAMAIFEDIINPYWKREEK